MISWSGVRKAAVIRQSNATECGLASVAMIAGHYGQNIHLASLREKVGVSMKGATLANLIAMAEILGLASRAVRCELEELHELQLPCILHWDLNHFVVLSRLRGKKLEIHDPAKGLVLMSLEEMDSHFTGIALELSPTADFKPHKDHLQRLKLSSMFTLDKTHLKPALQGLLLTLVVQALILVSPLFMQFVIDDGIINRDVPLIFAIACGFSMLLVFQVVSQIVRQLVFQVLSHSLIFDVKASIFHHLLRLPIGFIQSRSVGDVQTRFGEINHIGQVLTDDVIQALIDGFFAIIVGIILFSYNWKLALIVLVFAILYASIRIFTFRLSYKLSREQQEKSAAEASHFLSTLTAFQTIKLSGLELQREATWRNHALEDVHADIRHGNLQIGFSALSNTVSSLSKIVIVMIAAIAVINDQMTIGMLTAFLAFQADFEQRLIELTDKIMSLSLLSVHVDRIADIALTKQEPHRGFAGAEAPIEGEILLKDVSFRYAPVEENVLHDVNLLIRPGEFVALAGGSGHGKSTLLKLITSLYEPTSGQVLFDGQPVSKLGLARLRKQMGVVMQDDRLLPGSLQENISMFDPELDPERVRHVAQMACIHDEIEQMPMGYETLVGDMGNSLSGGQQQRVMIARALYRNPKILILDEGTSQLDVPTEDKINSNLQQQSITRICAAHRPDTLKKADRIIWIHDGRLEDTVSYSEMGGPEERFVDVPTDRLVDIQGGLGAAAPASFRAALYKTSEDIFKWLIGRREP